MWFRKRVYMEWEQYQQDIAFLSEMSFQQDVRKTNLINLGGESCGNSP